MREVNMQPLQIRYMTMEQSLNNQSGNNLTQKLFQKVRSAPNVRLKMHPSSSICCLPLIWFRVTGGLRLFWVERWGTPCTGDQAIAELTQTDNCSHSCVHEENPHRQRGNNQTPHRKASTSQWIVRHNTVLQYFFLFFYISTKVKYFREMLTVMLTDSGKKTCWPLQTNSVALRVLTSLYWNCYSPSRRLGDIVQLVPEAREKKCQCFWPCRDLSGSACPLCSLLLVSASHCCGYLVCTWVRGKALTLS